MAFSSWSRITSYSKEIYNSFNSVGLAMFCQYGLKGIEAAEVSQNCRRPFCPQIFIGKNAGISSNIFFRNTQGWCKRNNVPGSWLKSHGEQWTGSHSQGAKLKSNQRTFSISRVGKTDSICPEKNSELLWTSDCYVVSLPLSRLENLYGSF